MSPIEWNDILLAVRVLLSRQQSATAKSVADVALRLIAQTATLGERWEHEQQLEQLFAEHGAQL